MPGSGRPAPPSQAQAELVQAVTSKSWRVLDASSAYQAGLGLVWAFFHEALLQDPGPPNGDRSYTGGKK